MSSGRTSIGQPPRRTQRRLGETPNARSRGRNRRRPHPHRTCPCPAHRLRRARGISEPRGGRGRTAAGRPCADDRNHRCSLMTPVPPGRRARRGHRRSGSARARAMPAALFASRREWRAAALAGPGAIGLDGEGHVQERPAAFGARRRPTDARRIRARRRREQPQEAVSRLGRQVAEMRGDGQGPMALTEVSACAWVQRVASSRSRTGRSSQTLGQRHPTRPARGLGHQASKWSPAVNTVPAARRSCRRRPPPPAPAADRPGRPAPDPEAGRRSCAVGSSASVA